MLSFYLTFRHSNTFHARTEVTYFRLITYGTIFSIHDNQYFSDSIRAQAVTQRRCFFFPTRHCDSLAKLSIFIYFLISSNLVALLRKSMGAHRTQSGRGRAVRGCGLPCA